MPNVLTTDKFDDRLSNLRIGSNISIRIGNIGPISGQVKWIEGFTLGVHFHSPIQQYVLDHMLTTIDGWNSPVAQPQDSGPPDNGRTAGAASRIQMSVRAATIGDVREALGKSGLSLPIASQQELADLFHHLLKIVADESEGNSRPAS